VVGAVDAVLVLWLDEELEDDALLEGVVAALEISSSRSLDALLR
jgi:hypothetical protein